MNKTLILFLAICLISAHAFVRRDAPEAPKDDNILEKINKQFSEGFEGIRDQVNKSLDPETLKKNINDIINNVSKAFEDLKPKEAPKE